MVNLDTNLKSQIEKEVGPLSFALFMRVARNSLGLTQEAFGRKVGFTRANICDIEKGRYAVSPIVAVKVARKTGLPEELALQACLQDLVFKAGSEAKVVVK